MDTRQELVRRQTFDNSLYSNDRACELALFGFILSKPPDVVQCVFCYLQLRLCPLRDDDILLDTHIQLSPNCPLLLQRATGNVTISPHLLSSVLPAISYDTV